MKILKYLSLVLMVVALTVSCQKQEIEYGTTPISGVAEFQLHYFVPVPALAANNITKVEIDGKLYANAKAPLTTYNGIPSAATTVGRFYTIKPGNHNIKMYTGTASDVLVYDQNVDLTQKKQNVFVHSFTLPPIVFDNEYPYVANLTEGTDSICWVKFYNFLYETTGVPTTLRLQYQYIDIRYAADGTTELKRDTLNIGQPVLFGETTGWQPVKVIKSIYNSSGYRRIDYRIKVIDDLGVDIGQMQIMNTSGVYKNYADYWNGYIGRRYHHIISGLRAATTSPAAVRVFTAL